MKNSKKVSLVVLVLLAFLLTGFTWSYWSAGNVETATYNLDANTIVLGASKGQSVATSVVTAKIDSTTPLVPAGRAIYSKDGSQESVTMSHKVKWDTKNLAQGVKGTLTVKIVEIKIDDKLENANLVVPNVREQVLAIDGDGSVDFNFAFTLTEPSSKAVYDAIAGKKITYKLELTVKPN
ncbi:hypothetical protein G7062_04825 [Erysipelothrix sp. HDW6C]|uniref:hypothetical protein n=1 Tax=Erysipelothrix sp. HDW6C TaxID=2714930 RepID=UPI0014082F40|nr:hypothetical protein [Erysipelothrix sp. HDW6C]QIK69661.1 hypothetical protein G7062_04825 [Erysipelothrix sp. HDW6C]